MYVLLYKLHTMRPSVNASLNEFITKQKAKPKQYKQISITETADIAWKHEDQTENAITQTRQQGQGLTSTHSSQSVHKKDPDLGPAMNYGTNAWRLQETLFSISAAAVKYLQRLPESNSSDRIVTKGSKSFNSILFLALVFTSDTIEKKLSQHLCC